MHRVHGSAFGSLRTISSTAPVMVPFPALYATALKAMNKAGRRGGDSIARGWGNMYCLGDVMHRLPFKNESENMYSNSLIVLEVLRLVSSALFSRT